MKIIRVDNFILLDEDITNIQKEEQATPWNLSSKTGQRRPIIPTASKLTRCKATSGIAEAGHHCFCYHSNVFVDNIISTLFFVIINVYGRKTIHVEFSCENSTQTPSHSHSVCSV